MADRARRITLGLGTAWGILRALPGGPWLAGLVVLLGAVATAFEGVGIVLVLPFLERLIGGSATTGLVSLHRLAGFGAWLETFEPGWQLPLIAALVFGAMAGREAIVYANGLLKTALSIRIANEYRARLHDALVSAELRVSTRAHHGYWQNMLHIEANRLIGLAQQVLSFGEMVAVAVTVFVVMIVVAGPLTLGALAVVGLVAIPFIRMFGWIHRSGGDRLESRVRLMTYLAEFLPFLTTVHAAHGQEHERRRLAVNAEALYRKDMRLQRLAGSIGPLHRLLGAAGVLGVVLVAVNLQDGQAGSLAWIIPFVLLFSRLLPIMNGVHQTIGTLGDGLAAYQRFVTDIEFLRAHRLPEGTLEFPSAFGGIEAQHLSFSYDGDNPVLRDVSVVIPRGTHVAFTGPSGSGKSTLCLLLCRLHDPTLGGVLVDGVPLSHLALAGLRRAIAFVEQTPVLVNDSIRANVTYGVPGATDDEVWAALRAAHAAQFVAQAPGGLDTPVGNLGSALSGGERQRIALARALVRRPKVLVLDEVTSAVDAKTEAAIRDCIEQLRGHTTIVNVAHRLSTIRDADEIHFLKEGRIVASGTFGELLARSDEFRAFVELQELSGPAEPSQTGAGRRRTEDSPTP